MQKDRQSIPCAPFRPLMSNAVFATKWSSKFRNLWSRHSDILGNMTDALLMGIFAEEAFNHTDSFILDVMSHNMKPCNFHDRAKRCSTTMEEFMDEEKPDPYFGWLQTTHAVDAFLERLLNMKLHGHKLLGVPWQALPFRLRERLNHNFEIVEFTKKQQPALWPVTEEQRKKWKIALKEEEEKALLETS